MAVGPESARVLNPQFEPFDFAQDRLRENISDR